MSFITVAEIAVARNRTKGMLDMTLTLTKMNVNSVNWALTIGADLVLVAILLSLVGAYSETFTLPEQD